MHTIIPSLIALLVGFWVFWDAKARGRPDSKAILWGMGTFLMMLVVLPLWLFYFRGKEYSDSENRNFIGSISRCSSCGGSFKFIPNAKYCPFCGKALHEDENYPDITINRDDGNKLE